MSFKTWWAARDIYPNTYEERHLAKLAYEAGAAEQGDRQESVVRLLRALGTAEVERAVAQVEWLRAEAERGRSMTRLLDAIGSADVGKAVEEVYRLKERDGVLARLLERGAK